MRQHLEPTVDHPITTETKQQSARVSLDGRMIVDANSYIELREASYGAIVYLPRDAANMSLLLRSDHTSWCPYKGEATYFHIRRSDGTLSENAIWTYENPFPAIASIKDALAFYPDRVDTIEIG